MILHLQLGRTWPQLSPLMRKAGILYVHAKQQKQYAVGRTKRSETNTSALSDPHFMSPMMIINLFSATPAYSRVMANREKKLGSEQVKEWTTSPSIIVEPTTWMKMTKLFSVRRGGQVDHFSFLFISIMEAAISPLDSFHVPLRHSWAHFWHSDIHCNSKTRIYLT